MSYGASFEMLGGNILGGMGGTGGRCSGGWTGPGQGIKESLVMLGGGIGTAVAGVAGGD